MNVAKSRVVQCDASIEQSINSDVGKSNNKCDIKLYDAIQK